MYKFVYNNLLLSQMLKFRGPPIYLRRIVSSFKSVVFAYWMIGVIDTKGVGMIPCLPRRQDSVDEQVPRWECSVVSWTLDISEKFIKSISIPDVNI